MQVSAYQAIADGADPLRQSTLQQSIKEAQMDIVITERKKQIEVQEQEIVRAEKQLFATVRRPAEAERYKIEQEATAEGRRSVALAEAEGEHIRMKARAQCGAALAALVARLTPRTGFGCRPRPRRRQYASAPTRRGP